MIDLIIIAEFLPICVTLFYVLFPLDFLYMSQSALGKLFFISLIIFYTLLDKVVGTFLALLFILYYQSDLVENFQARNH